MLWALPAVLLPLAVHLLNRLRHRPLRWAATMFLVAATRSSTRRARLRHYLILACRVLAILCILLALSRPLAGGWLGAALGRRPELVIVLLDRSASMETLAPGGTSGRRAHVLGLLAEHPAGRGGGPTSFVLIDSARREPLEIAGLEGLPDLGLAQATDTAADLPAMFRAALVCLAERQPGSAEIWVVSDLQAGNWRPASGEWRALAARLAGLPRPPRVRILDCGGGGERNLSVSLRGLELRPAPEDRSDKGGGELQLRLAADLRAARPPRGSFPMIATINGVRHQVEIEMAGTELHYQGVFAIPSDRPAGLGTLEIPADDNPRDNIAYFAYAAETPLRAAVLAADKRCAEVLLAAAAPNPRRFGHSAARLEPGGLTRLAWSELDLLIWQGTAPDAAGREAVRAFAAGGGVVICFPPGGEGGPGLFDLRWGAVETAAGDLWQTAEWDELEGPLARTAGGASLPIAQMEIRRRQSAQPAGAGPPDANWASTNLAGAGPAWVTLASMSDRRDLLQSARIGAGRAVWCATLPREDWSDLEEGAVLVPMIQRLLRDGGARRQAAQLADCGEWQPDGDNWAWQALASSGAGDPACHAGIYARADRQVALNIPPAELLPGALDSAQAAELFEGLEVAVSADVLARQPGRAESEIWPLLICAALAVMLLETLLASPARAAPLPAAPRPAGSR